jgi:hypothetical protein
MAMSKPPAGVADRPAGCLLGGAPLLGFKPLADLILAFISSEYDGLRAKGKMR